MGNTWIKVKPSTCPILKSKCPERNNCGRCELMRVYVKFKNKKTKNSGISMEESK